MNTTSGDAGSRGADAGSANSVLLREGLAHHATGQLDAAEAVYRNVLASHPADADALHLLGMVAHARNHSGQAVDLIRRAIAHRPGSAEFHNNLGTVLGAEGRTLDAEAAFRQAVALRPE